MRHLSKLIIIVVTMLLGTANGRKSYLNFDCSTYEIRNVNEDNSYEISWNGNSISSYSCKIGLHAFDYDEPLNEYKICIKATTWTVNNQQVKLILKYYTGIVDSLEKTYSRNSFETPITEWCSESGEYVDIHLETDSAELNQGKIVLEVTGVITYDNGRTLGIIVGSVMGGLLLVSIIITVVVILACRRQRSPGILFSNAASNGTIITQAGHQQAGGYGNQGFAATPAYNSQTQSAFPVVSQNGYPPNQQGTYSK